MNRTIPCLLLTLCLLLLSAAAMAASDPDNYFFDFREGNITIEDADTSEMVKVTYGNPQTTTAEFDPQEHVITVAGGRLSNSPQLSINTTVPVKIIYQVNTGDYSIQITISIANNADVTLSLTGPANDVSGTTTQPGIKLGSGSKLTIQATADNNSLRVYGSPNAILGPGRNEPPATVILNSGTVAIISYSSGSGISGNVNLVINGGQFKANGKDIDVNSLIVTGGELWAGDTDATKVTYKNLSNYKNQIKYKGGILPENDYLVAFGDVTLPVDLTIQKKLVFDGAELTIPTGRSLTLNNMLEAILSNDRIINYGTLTLNRSEAYVCGVLVNDGILCINSSLVLANEQGSCTLTNNGTISGTGWISP